MPYSTGVVIPVNKGDKVRLLFELSIFTPKEHIATVTRVEQRYGRVNDGRDKQNPLIYYTPSRLDDRGAVCDAVFVEEVIERAPSPARPENIYRELKEARKISAQRVGGFLVGDIFDCVAFCLAKLDIRLNTPLHPIRMHNLFWRSKRGFIASCVPTIQYGEDTIVVREKSFSNWVKDNATRLVYHRVELDAEETASNRRYEDEYYAYMEDELDRTYPDTPEDVVPEKDVDYEHDHDLGEQL